MHAKIDAFIHTPSQEVLVRLSGGSANDSREGNSTLVLLFAMHRKFAFSVLQMILHHLLSFLGEVGSIIGTPSSQTHLPPHTYLLSATSEAGAVADLAECRQRLVRLPSSNLLFHPSSN